MKARICTVFIFAGLLSYFLALIPLPAAEIENFESLEITDSVLPEYPVRLAYEGIFNGRARVMISVDRTGQLTDVFMESYSHPEFGRLADNYIRKWAFKPAKLNGEPISSIKPVNFYFDDKRGVFSMGSPEAMASHFFVGNNREAKRIYGVQELDKQLEALEITQPLYPLEFKYSGIDGTATIMFYVDETGSVRMPYTTEYSHRSFGQTALGAVRKWKFKPPMVKGKPVSILVRQTFQFNGASGES